jgi:hypothetical protein
LPAKILLIEIKKIPILTRVFLWEDPQLICLIGQSMTAS